MLEEGPFGFEGDINAQKPMRLTGVSRATATRELQHLHTIGTLRRIGPDEIHGMRLPCNPPHDLVLAFRAMQKTVLAEGNNRGPLRRREIAAILMYKLIR